MVGDLLGNEEKELVKRVIPLRENRVKKQAEELVRYKVGYLKIK